MDERHPDLDRIRHAARDPILLHLLIRRWRSEAIRASLSALLSLLLRRTANP